MEADEEGKSEHLDGLPAEDSGIPELNREGSFCVGTVSDETESLVPLHADFLYHARPQGVEIAMEIRLPHLQRRAEVSQSSEGDGEARRAQSHAHETIIMRQNNASRIEIAKGLASVDRFPT